jgi:hypothetical protein
VRDFQACLELRRKKEISFWGWIKSVLHFQHVPFFKLSDPMPSIKQFKITIKNYLHYKIGKLRKRNK